MFRKKVTGKLDTAGMLISIACAIHCAMLPLIITLLPLLGLKFLVNDYFEIAIILCSLIIGYTSLTIACRRHKHARPLVILTAGFGLIFAGKVLMSHHYEWLFLGSGGLMIAAAHFYNMRLSAHVH